MTGSGSRRDQRSLRHPGRSENDPSLELILRRAGGGAKLAEVDAERFVESAHLFQCAVDVDRLFVAAPPQLGNHALRLSQRIGAHQHASTFVLVQTVQQVIDFAARVGMAEDGKPERRLGNEDVARHRHEFMAGGVRPPFVIAGNDDFLARMLEHDLCASEHMACGYEGDIDVADTESLSVRHGLARFGAVAKGHDGESLGGGENRAVTAARMIAVAVSHERPLFRLRRVDPRIGWPDIKSVGESFDPGTQTRHCEL